MLDCYNDMFRINDIFWICLVDDLYNEFKILVLGIVIFWYGFRSGCYYNGIDIDFDMGDMVCVVFSGKVCYVKYNDGGFGNLVVICYYNGFEMFYVYFSKYFVVFD